MGYLKYFYCEQCERYLTNKEISNHLKEFHSHKIKEIFTDKKRVRLSKLLSIALRHQPKVLQIQLDNEGFTNLEKLINQIKKRNNFEWVNRKMINAIIELDNKGRFEINDNNIRARYGHSIPRIKINLKNSDLPEILYHGTNYNAYIKIENEGIKPMGRNLVHLTSFIKDAKIVGSRHHGKLVLLEINVNKAINNGYQIWRAGKNVYVTNFIPKKYINMIKNE